MDTTLTPAERVALRARLDSEAQAEAAARVAFLLRQFNAAVSLPEAVTFKGRAIPTGQFLRGLALNPVTRGLPALHLFQRGLGQNANDLAAQAADLADAAEREGLLAKVPDAAPDLSSGRGVITHLLSRGNTVPTVTVEPLKADPATAARNAARDAAEARAAEADRGRLAEVHKIRGDKARGMFDRSAFRSQTSGETAKA